MKRETSMEEMLNRLDTWLRKYRPDYYQELQPGASDEAINELETSLGFQLPSDFKTFLTWKNGQVTATSSIKPFFLDYVLMGTQDILNSGSVYRDLYKSPPFAKNWWSPLWVPFLYTFSGDHYCIDMEGSFGGERGQVLTWWHDDESRDVLHMSFYKWVQTVVIAMERCVLPYNGVGDYSKYEVVLKEANPGYPKRRAAGE